MSLNSGVLNTDKIIIHEISLYLKISCIKHM